MGRGKGCVVAIFDSLAGKFLSNENDSHTINQQPAMPIPKASVLLVGADNASQARCLGFQVLLSCAVLFTVRCLLQANLLF
jgi:hypothetical protein